MKSSVNISKITSPHLPDILDRPRLLNLLKKNEDKKLILILGQAAQGKSTLVASYLKTSKTLSPWMNLDKEDSDSVNLYHILVQSLQHVLKDADLSHLPDPSQAMGPREEIPLYREWAQSVFKRVSIPVQIIIDGLDHLSSDASAFAFLQTLVEEAPPNVHLLMLSREMPPLLLEFQNLKMKQAAFVLTNEDLAFTQEEVRDFFQNIRKISFNTGQLKKVYSATEGWIGGLVLFAEFLDRFPESTREKFISQALPDHFKREVFQYLGKEIFSSQPEPVQEFLIKSSILDLIEPAFIRDFTGSENVEIILKEHARRNLFVQSFYDEKKGWLFRYHPLFKDFLKAKLTTSIGDKERESMLLKAATLYEQRGDLENSIRYFLDAKAYPQAASVIRRLGMDLLKKGRIGDLSEWLHALPENTVQDNPWLLFYLAMTRRFTGGRENIIAFQKAHTLFKQAGDIKGSLISLAQLIEVCVHAGTYLVPIENLIEEGEAELQPVESNEYPYERAVLWHFIGLARIMGEGDIRRGIWACQNAYSISKQLRDFNLQAYALSFSALGFILLGEFALADDSHKKIEKIMEKSVYAEFKAVELMIQCLLKNHQGDFDKSQALLEELQDEIEKHGFVYMVPWTYEISGYLMAAQGEFSEAEKIGKQYLNVAISLKNGLFKGSALRLLGLTYLYKNDFEKAREALERSMTAFSEEAPSRYHFHRVKIKMGLVCTQRKEYKRAEKELDEALEYFSSISAYISLAEVQFALALLKQAEGKKKDVVLYLQNGFKIAKEKKYTYFYNLGSTYLLRACLLALELKVDGAIDYAAHLLATRLSSVAEEELKKLSNHPDSRLREKVWEIRRMIHRSKIPRLRIETLGGLQVFRGDSPIEENQWDRIQPKQLLKAIVSYGGHRIPKEILIDELWQEENPKVAENSFKTTLQRLRKSLEPLVHKDFGSSYIHLHENIVLLDSELCDVDADRFLSLFKMAEEKEKRGDTKAALSFYTEAAEIYKGDFVPEELYAPWVDKMREELRGKFIELLNKMAGLHERQGSLKKAMDCYKKVIQVDPLIEESYQKLMTFYSGRGMYNDALRTYEECKKALKKGLKSKPDTTTDVIHKKILERVSTSRPERKSREIGKMRGHKV
jgi:LuxR family maltose regulon positive regulatory protein